MLKLTNLIGNLWEDCLLTKSFGVKKKRKRISIDDGSGNCPTIGLNSSAAYGVHIMDSFWFLLKRSSSFHRKVFCEKFLVVA